MYKVNTVVKGKEKDSWEYTEDLTVYVESKDEETIENELKDIYRKFNRSRRPHELEREFISFEILNIEKV